MSSLHPYNEHTLVSVIIPCYNHGHYLPEAIESVLKQTHPAVEIIVVDDGSNDNTKSVAQNYPGVKYIWQKNQGLSASRNTGIKNSTGSCIVFLDADDWLYENAISTNLHYLSQHEHAAFVFGAYDEVSEDHKLINTCRNEVKYNHYQQFLFSNYVGMISTVLYHRWVFEEFLFDETLKSCEDYDLYLRITRKYPIFNHAEKIAAYRKHSENMSLKFDTMLASSLEVLQRQRGQLKNADEIQAYKKGERFWKKYYSQKTYKKARSVRPGFSKADLVFLLKNRPFLFFKFIIVHPIRQLIGNKLQFPGSKRRSYE